LVGLNHFTVPLAIHFVSAESKNKNGPPVPALTGTSASHRIPVCCKLDSVNGAAILAEKSRIPALLRLFACFIVILMRCNSGRFELFARKESATDRARARTLGSEERTDYPQRSHDVLCNSEKPRPPMWRPGLSNGTMRFDQ
jgi:hypothetical protein